MQLATVKTQGESRDGGAGSGGRGGGEGKREEIVLMSREKRGTQDTQEYESSWGALGGLRNQHRLVPVPCGRLHECHSRLQPGPSAPQISVASEGFARRPSRVDGREAPSGVIVDASAAVDE